MRGALSYLAPEVLEDPRNPQLASDVWAVSAMTWELLTGKPPFGSGLQAVSRIRSSEQPTLPPGIATHNQFGPLAKELAGILLKGMDRNIDRRWSTEELGCSL